MKKSILFLIVVLIISCGKKSNNSEAEDSTINNDSQVGIENNSAATDCGFEDGSYTATVDYNNERTGHTATYTLDVDVVDCEVVQINFPNGGYVDEDHITAAVIDQEGKAIVEGEKGKTYEIQLEN